MYRKQLSLILFIVFFLPSSSCQAEGKRMREVFAETPDSIFPFLTRNNRLDCIDFIENNMPARVKNRFESNSELKVLTDDYMLIRLSSRSQVEMKLVPRAAQGDTILCFVHTVEAGAADSHVRFFTPEWKELPIVCERPSVDAFMEEGMNEDARAFLRGLPLMSASLSADDTSLTWHLQTGVLEPSLRENAAKKTHPIDKDLAKEL